MIKLKRRELLLGALAAKLNAAAPKRPNFVLVLFDDLGWKDFACYGNDYHRTPNIDALAREGMRFTNAYAACPVCSPTRAAIQTGKYPPRTGVTDWIAGRAQWPTAKLLTPKTATQLKLEETTIAEALAPSGYVSASVGKWHLGGSGFGPLQQGFAHNTGGNERGSNQYFGPFQLPGLEGRGKEDYLTHELGKAAENWVGEQAGKRPFFLYFPNYAVHTPIQAPVASIERNEAKTERQATYRAMLEIADQRIGRLRELLKAKGEYENTVWIVTSDNGGLRFEGKGEVPFTDNSPLRAGKGHLYEGGIRVPLIVSASGWTQPATESAEPVASIDLMPTLLELAGAKAAAGIDGLSLVALLRRPAARLRREALYWHYPHYSNQGGPPGGAMREGDWKLIEFYEDGRLELFYLKGDSGEKRNLAVREAARAARMHAKLRAWRERCGAVMPAVNPGYDAAKADQGLAGVEAPTPPLR